MRKTKILLILIMVMLASFQTTQAYCQPEESEQPWNKEQMVRAEVLRVEDKPAGMFAYKLVSIRKDDFEKFIEQLIKKG